jgi:hypothetical protein
VVSNPEFRRLRVAALNLFDPTASPFSGKTYSHITTQSLGGEGGVKDYVRFFKKGDRIIYEWI